MKLGTMIRVVGVMGALVSAMAALPGEASACGTALSLSRIRQERIKVAPDNTTLVAQAEQALSEGKHQKAALLAVQAFPALKIIKPGTLPLSDRALRIMALASARTDGGVNAGGAFTGVTAESRAANLAWSVATMRTLDTQRVNNPSYHTDLGEVLAHLPEHKAEAAKILGELADKDLLTSAEGYAALARLRAENGDKDTRDALVKRCETMTKTPALCAVPAA